MGKHKHRNNRHRFRNYQNPNPSQHHRIPQSRLLKNNYSAQWLPRGFHDALHFVFMNMKQEEMHKFIDILYAKNSWSPEQIYNEQRRIVNAGSKPIREEKVILITPNFLNSYFHRGNHLLDKKTHRFSF